MSAPTMSAVSATAASLGLSMEVHKTSHGIKVVVWRDAEDWTVPPQGIALGHDEAIVAATAMQTLRQLAPRLQKKLASIAPEQDELALSAGVGSDGVVTTLRVERDGAVRLHPDDVEAIARRTADIIEDRRLYARTGLRVDDE